MKKRVLMLLAAVLCVCIVGCGDTATEKMDEFAENVKDSGADWVITPSESVKNAMINTWNVADSEDVYEFKADGTGTLNGDEFTFECGFNEDNQITMSIKSGSNKTVYAMSTDSTGYGVELEKVSDGEVICLLPADKVFLALDDERAAVTGSWTDASGNIYSFSKDYELVIDGVNNDSEGSFSIVEGEDDTLILCLVINGSGYEYEYKLSEDGETLQLQTPGDETVHEWTKTK